MGLTNNTTEKLFYRISEVAKIFGVNVSAVRFWEKQFDILKPKKNKKGNRMGRLEGVWDQICWV